MKKTILKIKFDERKQSMDIVEKGIKSGASAKNDETILFALCVAVVAKLKCMPVDAKAARKCFDKLCGEMEELFNNVFPYEEAESNE